jgi:M6 family metalloprotease-like protein
LGKEAEMYKKSRLVVVIGLVVLLLSVVGCGRRYGTSPDELPWIATPASVGTTETEIKLGLHTTGAVGEKKYVVILADFPDVKRQYSEDIIADRLLNFLSTYMYEASYHKLTFTGEMTKRYVLPYPVEHYKISPVNLDVDKNKVLSLVTDVVNAADADVAFSEDLYVIISLGATTKEYGMVGYSALPGMLGFMNTTPITTKNGEVVSKAVVFCENAHLGTYIHDTLHMLGGVVDGRRMTPCLYDHDLQVKYGITSELGKIAVNMGFWDPLSSHVPYNKELPPTGLSSWTRLRLGWIDPSKIALVKPGETTTIKLDPLVSDEASTLVIKIPVSDFTYYLIENRQPIESDVNLPSSGVLILYADDTVLECRHGSAPVKIKDANPDVPYLNDAAFDIGKKDTYVDVKNNLAIVLLQKEGQSYIIQITTPDRVNKGSGN